MLQLRHWKVSLEQRKSLRHHLRLLVSASAILFIHSNAQATPQADFSLSVNPAAMTILPGASATATVTITRRTGFTGSVTLDAFEAVPAVVLPSGVNVTFSPASTTGNSSVATITVPSTVTSSVVNMVISGSSGGFTTITQLTVNLTGLTIAAEVTENGPFFNQEQIRMGNTLPITSLSVTIVIERAAGLSVNGIFNTMGSQMTQSVATTPTTFVYQFNLVPGQTLQPEQNRVCAAQTNGSGTTRPTHGDTATITYTSGGVTHTETRTF